MLLSHVCRRCAASADSAALSSPQEFCAWDQTPGNIHGYENRDNIIQQRHKRNMEGIGNLLFVPG